MFCTYSFHHILCLLLYVTHMCMSFTCNLVNIGSLILHVLFYVFYKYSPFFFQSVIFHVDRHPKYPWFTQCVTFHFFPTTAHELAYNLFNLATLYGLPLIIISVSYCSILYQITKKTRQSKGK